MTTRLSNVRTSRDEHGPSCLPIEDLAYVKQMVVLDRIGTNFEIYESHLGRCAFRHVRHVGMVLRGGGMRGCLMRD